jgi:hypothetical protein
MNHLYIITAHIDLRPAKERVKDATRLPPFSAVTMAYTEEFIDHFAF